MDIERKTLKDTSLKEKTINGMLWSFFERFGYLAIQFSTNIILARLLTPRDFGLIGMMMVFIGLSTILVDGGLGAALIQRKKPTKKDYSTIFYINIFMSLLLYGVLFISSNSISKFYSQPQLELMLKVIGIVLITDSFNIVQNNILIKNLEFKKISKIKIISVFLASVLGIISALNGLGVWSLVIQYLSNSIFRTLFLWLKSTWFPLLSFSINSFKNLYGFGFKLLAASLLSELYRSFQTLLIGKYFSSQELGFFTQAKQLQGVPTTALMMVVNQVTFPIFSQLQNKPKKLIIGFKKSLKSLVFVNFPLMILMATIAKPLFTLLFTEKWLPSVPFFQLLSLGFGLLLVVHSLNLNIIKSLGRSDIVLKLEIIKKILGVSLIVFFLQFGIEGILIALAINSVLEFFLNGYFTKKLIGYSILNQLKDILPTLLLSSTIGLFVWYVFNENEITPLFLIIIQSIIFIALYFIGAVLLKFEAFKIYLTIIKNKLKK